LHRVSGSFGKFSLRFGWYISGVWVSGISEGWIIYFGFMAGLAIGYKFRIGFTADRALPGIGCASFFIIHSHYVNLSYSQGLRRYGKVWVGVLAGQGRANP